MLFFQTENSIFYSKCWGYTNIYYQLRFNSTYFFPTKHLHLGFFPPIMLAVMLANVSLQYTSVCLQRWREVIETLSISMTLSPDLSIRFDLESRTWQKTLITCTIFFLLSFGTKFKVKLSKKLQLCPLSPVT